MIRSLVVLLVTGCSLACAQTSSNGDYKLALTDHKGQLKWAAEGFKVVQNSAKPGGQEIGVRRAMRRGVCSWAFYFLSPHGAPLTSAKCRDSALKQEMNGNPALKIVKTSEISRPGPAPVALATYTAPARDGSLVYIVRGFVATADVCGDLEFYGSKPISEEDADLKKVFQSYELDPDYVPGFSDLSTYAQVLFQMKAYQAAAPIFEKALAKVPTDGAPFKSASMARRMMRDQAGMSYGISGQVTQARRVFEQGIAEDPDFPMYYYNLACADAGEKKLAEAKAHLQQAFDRKANVNSGEAMPDPTKDDSFLPYRSDKEFWAFIEQLQRGK